MLFFALILSLHLAARQPMDKALDTEQLIDAVSVGDAAMVTAALKAGFDPNQHKPGSQSLLTLAIVHKHYDIARILLAHGAQTTGEGNEGLIIAAINSGDLEILRLLVVAGAPVANSRNPKYCEDILCAVVRFGSIPMLEYLLANGADPNGIDGLGGETALGLGAILGRLDMVRILLSAGADINHRDWYGKTPLMLACESGKPMVAEYLLNMGADPTAKDRRGCTARSYACRYKGANAHEIQALFQGCGKE